MSKEFDPEDLQGNILRGYTLQKVRYLVLEVTDRGAARRFLAAAADGTSPDVPAITRSANWKTKPDPCFNIGVTFEGLRALGTPAEHLATFPTEFVEGMTRRAEKLGDFGDSAPARWPEPFDRPERVHIIATTYSNEEENLDEVQAKVEKAFRVLGVRNGGTRKDNKVYFGYVDGISQPRFRHVFDPDMVNANEPKDPLGTVLLGYPTRLEGIRFAVPSPNELGFNGSFNAFRVLAQDAAGFEAYLDQAAEFLREHPDVDELLPPGAEANFGENVDRVAALREVVAAQMCGRWRNGVPYSGSPDTPKPKDKISLSNFDYDLQSACPAGSHMRRVNPRGGPIVQRVAHYTRRLVRRGMPYGPEFDPANPDDRERGLLGNFIGANIGAQFEAVMCDWLNLGLQDPDVTGANDPLIGANSRETSWFDLKLRNGGSIRIREIPRFVNARGGAYTFLPSLPAIRYLSRLTS